jgi:hypothetical protein
MIQENLHQEAEIQPRTLRAHGLAEFCTPIDFGSSRVLLFDLLSKRREFSRLDERRQRSHILYDSLNYAIIRPARNPTPLTFHLHWHLLRLHILDEEQP